MEESRISKPWVSFCMSTYKRPVLLKKQLESILLQTYKSFEIIVSDNDPECSAKSVVEDINDSRVKYFWNNENIGMVASFNKSIERASTDFVIMITDDDPIDPIMLEDFFSIINSHPDLGIYIGCERNNKQHMQIEKFDRSNFLYQILHPELTTNLLWSSCVLRKDILLNIGGMPDYGSPHLADHAMIALCGCDKGGVIINRMYSHLTAHDNNFSKANIHLYYPACVGFYSMISNAVSKDIYVKGRDNALLKHLSRWFIVGMFSLKNYYTYVNYNQQKLKDIANESQKILGLDFMKSTRFNYYKKSLIFHIKRLLKFKHLYAR